MHYTYLLIGGGMTADAAARGIREVHQPALTKVIRVEHEDNTKTMGRCAGRAMAGALEPYDHRWIDNPMVHLLERDVTDDQPRRFESYAAAFFTAFGMDLQTPAMVDTPRRFIQAIFDVSCGLQR